jgi:hypothetical protein
MRRWSNEVREPSVSNGGKPHGWHWHEYPIGAAGEVAGACARSLMAVLVGQGGAFALILSGASSPRRTCSATRT